MFLTMKKLIKVYGMCVTALAIVWSCGGDVQPPTLHDTDKTLISKMTVADFKAAFWQEGTDDYSREIKSTDGRSILIEGVVLATDVPRPGWVVIGDSSGALTMEVSPEAEASKYAVGQKVELSPGGLMAGRRETVFMLGKGDALSPLGSAERSAVVKLIGEPDASQASAIAMPLSHLDADDALLRWQSRLVRLDYVSFDGRDGDDYILREANGATIIMSLPFDEAFDWDASAIAGMGSVTGIVSTSAEKGATVWRVYPRCGDDIEGFSCPAPDDPENPDAPDGPDTPEPPSEPDNCADFSTLNGGSNATGYAGTYTTARGWTAKYCAVASGGAEDSPSQNIFTFMGDASVRGPVLNGRIGGLGSIVSPVLTGGISRLEFSYGFPFEERRAGFTVNIRQDGAVVLSTSVTVDNIQSRHPYGFSWDVECQGDFVIEILNNGLTASSGDKDRLAVWNLSWTPAP